MNEKVTAEELLRQVNQIFEEREKEYQLREKQFENQNASLQQMLSQISDRNRELELQKEGIKKIQDSLISKQEELRKVEKRLKEEEEKIQAKDAEISEREKNLVLKHNLELEKIRNQEMKLQRLSQDYEYNLSLMDSGVGVKEEALQTFNPVNMEDYISKKEHEQITENYNERIEKLESERRKLMEQIFNLKNTVTRPSVSTQEEIKEADEKEKPPYPEETDVLEELTANVLYNYIKKNESRFQDIEILHSKQGEILSARCNTLEYHFTFDDPAFFDIAAKRKYDSRLKSVLEKFNSLHPETQFFYDKTEGKVYATGYFHCSMNVHELMRRVNEIADCFSPNR